MIGDDEDIGGAKVDQCADIEAKTEIGNNTDKMRYKNEEDKLVLSESMSEVGRQWSEI